MYVVVIGLLAEIVGPFTTRAEALRYARGYNARVFRLRPVK